MANVQFLKGTQSKLNSLTSYEAGAFYLTEDSDRLYYAQSSNELVYLNKNIITVNNEVYIDYGFILDKELEALANSSRKSAFLAISPDDKTKFMFQSNKIETIILNNIRENDILMNYAPGKYFVLLYYVIFCRICKLTNYTNFMY